MSTLFQGFSGSTGLTGTGTTLGTALKLLPRTFHQVSTAPASSAGGVVLPVVPPSTPVTVRNDGSSSLTVYPTTSLGSVNSGSAGAGVLLAAGSSATYVSNNGQDWFTSTGASGNLVPMVDPGASRAIAVGESGTIFNVSAAAARVYTLPAASAANGAMYEFFIGTGGANTVTISAPTASQVGQLQYSAAAPTATTSLAINTSTSVVFAASQAIGAFYRVRSNGTNWLGYGVSSIATGFTVA